MHCSTPIPLEPLAQPRMVVSCWHTWGMGNNAPTPHLQPQLSPRAATYLEAPSGWGWPQEARTDKSSCPETHMVVSLLYLDFYGIWNHIRIQDTSCILLFPLSFSFFLFLPIPNSFFLKYGLFKVGWVEFAKTILSEIIYFDWMGFFWSFAKFLIFWSLSVKFGFNHWECCCISPMHLRDFMTL